MKHPLPTAAIRSGLVTALVLAVLLPASRAGAEDPPTSWEYPLLPHVHGLAFQPSQPNDAEVTSVILSAVYPIGDCWRLVGHAKSDANHVSVTLELDESCGGDSVSGWVQAIELGAFAPGIHPLTVRAKLARPGADTTYEERTIGFEVVDNGTPPPPPPGPVDSTNALVSYYTVTPANPGPTDAVTVNLAGRYPFDCGVIAAASIDQHALRLTLGRGVCADTNHAWTYAFELGVLPVGTTTYTLDVAAERVSGTTHEYLGIPITVVDPDAPPPPPPPPPEDSLEAGLSPSHPNPFRDETRFSVSILESRQAHVEVFDLSGRRVATVFRGVLPSGTSQLAWNGRHADGRRASGGIYFYRLTLPDRVVTRRVVLLGTP